MPRASAAPNKLPEIVERLKQAYPDPRVELHFANPLQLLVASILAARCTDERVNRITPALFGRFPDAQAFAAATPGDIENLILSIPHCRRKAQAIKEGCRIMVERFGGEVPRAIDDLVTLPRVARKTANIVLNQAYGIASGIVVDTHVERVVKRLGVCKDKTVEKIEQELMAQVPQPDWISFGGAMVLHGRYVCTARKPKCSECVLENICPKIGVQPKKVKPKMPRKRSKAKAGPDLFAGAGLDSAAAKELRDRVPADWRKVLAAEFEQPYFTELAEFVAAERAGQTIYPPEDDVFNALKYTPYAQVKVLLLGQDPYHGPNQAHGLCFSVKPGVTPPPSLINIFKELKNDLGCQVPNNGFLVPWAKQGVLLLNAVLTVRAGQPNSHKDHGWEHFTDAVIRAVNAKPEGVVFVLWGGYAQKKEKLIDAKRNVVLKAAHPSPLSVAKFFGSRPFSAVNKALTKLGHAPIDWQLPDV
jgi:uracil-DNA glycosylase